MLTWPSQPGTRYRIERASAPGAWTTLADDVDAEATGSSTTFDTGLPASPPLFFRVGLKE